MSRNLSRRGFVATTALAATAWAITGRSGVAFAQAPTIKCGVVTSLSGENMMGGTLTRRGYELWSEQINKKGGVEIGGQRYPVKMFYGDAQSEPSSGAAAAERLIVQDEVDVLFGPYTSGVTLAVQPICTKYRVPMISGSAESPNVWLAKPPFNFGMIPSVDLSSGKSIRLIAENAKDPKPQSAAVIGVNEPFSKETAEGFRGGVEEVGLELKHYELIPAKADLTPIISNLAAMSPDLVAVGGHEEVLINFIRAAKSLNFRPKAIIMHYGVTAPAFAEQLGTDADGIFGITMWTADVPYQDALFGSAKDYDQLSFERWGTHPDYTEAACSASGLVLMDAAARLGKAPPWSEEDHQALADAIEATDLETFYGPIKFETSGDHFHDNTQPVPVLIQIKKGQTVPVAPADSAKEEMIYPLPAWS
jgi:branched-chain amino acid transport system substrate-binding protein